MKKCINLFLVTVVASLPLISQRLPTGTWKTHFSYGELFDVTLSGNRIFSASSNGLLTIDENGNLSTLTTTDGLYSGGITSIQWIEDPGFLAVGFESGVIQLISKNEIKTLTVLKDTDIVFSRKINGFEEVGSKILVACDLGIAVIDKQQQVLTDIYREVGPDGLPVIAYEVRVAGDTLYTSTSEGLLFANVNSNLFDFNNWEVLDDQIVSFSQLVVNSADRIFWVKSDSLLVSRHAELTYDTLFSSSSPIKKVTSRQDQLFILSATGLNSFSDTSSAELFISDFTAGTDISSRDGNTFHITTKGSGLLRLNLSQNMVDTVKFGSPHSDRVAMMRASNGSALLTFDRLSSSTTGANTGYFSYFSDSGWFTERLPEVPVYSALEVRGELFLATSKGVYQNSAQRYVGETSQDTISDLVLYRNGIAATIYGKGGGLYLEQDQSWRRIPGNTIGSEYPERIANFEGEQLWITRTDVEGGGISVWSPSDDQFAFISTADGLPSTMVRNLAFSYEDEVWITTDRGVRALPDATFVFSEERAGEILYQGAPILEDFVINTTAFDGGNRPWIGTDDGLWLFNEILSEQLSHFTVENSPLPSNLILQLAYDSDYGLLYVLTDKGLVSYQTASSRPEPTHSDVNIFPNPVRLGIHSNVTLTGLAQEAILKITTIEGQLVREVRASGSSAVWELRDLNGQKVEPGIYIVLSSRSDGDDNFIGKIAITR